MEKITMSDVLKNKIVTHRIMSNIDRLATTMKIRKYSLAEHSYYVAAMFEDFARQELIKYTTQDMYLIMRHDYLETLTSDLIFPVKKLSAITEECWDEIEREVIKDENEYYGHTLISDQQLKEKLDPTIYALMKDCDQLDLFLFCMEEIQMGNANSEIKRIVRILKDNLSKSLFWSVKDFVYSYIEDHVIDAELFPFIKDEEFK